MGRPAFSPRTRVNEFARWAGGELEIPQPQDWPGGPGGTRAGPGPWMDRGLGPASPRDGPWTRINGSEPMQNDWRTFSAISF
jgi:hypothetical protein